MVDFNKKIKNSSKFREPAITFELTGKYCNYASNTSEYFSYWDELKRRCLEGYTAEDGDWISGYNYFYLNFCPINRSVNKKIKDRHGKDKIVTVLEVAFPDFWDYDYYYFLTVQEAEEIGKHLCVLKSRRKGYEQPYSEEVLTPNGFVQMGSLKVGDMVMNPNGSPVRIGDIVEQGVQEVYEVEFQDGRIVRCGANHLWATCRNGKKFYIMPTKEYAKRKLTQGSKGKEHYPYKVPAINPLRFDEKPIYIDPYVLGVLLGDGYICGSQVRFSTADQFIVEELSRRLPDYTIKKIESDKYAYVIISKDKRYNSLNRELKKLGIKVKANKKFIPENYKYSSIENRFELIRGLMDTDGSVTNGASTFVSTSEQLIDDLQFVLRSLGIRCHKSKEIEGRFGVEFNNGCKSDTLPHWELCITTQEDIFKLPRKLEKIRKDRKYNYNGIGIKAIRRTGKFEKQRCLCIDNENHLYITKDFIPTHNSYKNGSMLCRNYYLIPNSKSYVYASNKQYLTDDGILTKAWDYMDFIDKNTAWGKKRSVNTAMRKRAGFFTKDEFGNEVELGYKSEIIGVTLKDNPDIVRGKKAKLILFEEAGSFKELGAAWQIARPSVEVDGVAFGTMIAFGCVCKGSRVWTSDGNCINIENLRQEDGIIGWDTYQASIQNIENINPISLKECVQIELQSGRTIRCSKDHPLLWSTPGRTKRVSGKRFENERMKSWLWHEAQKCKIGDQVGLIDLVPIFGKNVMWEPRFIGWLIGDGSYGNNKTPILSNCELEILDYVHSHFDTVIEKQYTTKDNKNYQEIRIKGICELLRKLGIYGQTKGNKRLPIDFNSYDEYTISELIGGLYDTDGYIHFSKKRARIVLTLCLKDILLLVQEALLHFGIHGIIRYIKPTNRIRKYKDHSISDKKGEYRLEIADVVSLGRFSQHIKLTVSRKSAALDLIYLFIQSKLPKYNKYLCGIVADKITNITDIGIQDIYNITAKEQHNYIVNGIVTHNTGGDEESNFATLKDMFYKPKGYNCIELLNIWDENAVNSTCGFFIPLYTNMDIRDDKGNRIYMDDDGNTLRKPSLDFILEQRKEMIQNATNSVAVDRYVCERCITPAEACLEFGGNIFPKKELLELLARIRTNKQLLNHKQIGDLVQTSDGNISWIIKKTGDITHYPLNKDDDPTGSIVIWEHPMKDAPFGLYIAGIDPYDHDLSGTNSLGSCIIYKRVLNIESYSDIIVAEYTGRPQAADDFYENVRKLLIYYNARAMYENQNKGLFVYFANKHCDYLLADQPDIINDIVGNSKVLRKKGCHMNKSIKAWGEGLIKDWLNDINADGKKNLYNILSEPLLEELIAYNDIGNFDRCVIKDTLITTQDGYKKVLDILIGDKVLTHSGKLKKVTWIDKHVHKGNKTTLRLIGDYRKLECTDNHPILVGYTDRKSHKFRKDCINNIHWLRADLLNYKYQFGLIPKRHLTEKIDLSDDVLYLLGWIMSDGYVSSNSNGIKITYLINLLNCAKKCLSVIENYLLDETYYYSKNNTKRIIRKPSKIYRYNNCYRLEVYSKKLHDLCTWFGCKPNNKKINIDIYNKYNNLMPFIIGWLEGDGHQKLNINYDGHNRNCIELSTIYSDLLLQCRQIMIDSGIYSSIRKVKSKLGKELISLCFSNEYINKCLDFYPSLKFLKINVKKNTSRVLETDDGFWSQIQLLEIAPIEETVYNFEVEDDHTYIANGIVTHNCMALMLVMIYREQLFNVVVKEKEKENKNRLLFDGPIFAQNWFDDESPIKFNDDNVYTFTN